LALLKPHPRTGGFRSGTEAARPFFLAPREAIKHAGRVDSQTNSLDPERVADFYAADLLLPRYLFIPRAAALRYTTFESIDTLCKEYSTSIPATAIRLVECGPEPAMLVCHGPAGRKWFNRPRHIPERWFPRDELAAESSAMNVLFGKNRFNRRATVGAEAWFDRRDANRFELYEQSFKMSDQEILTLLVFTNDEMLEPG